ncbi:hypothetical protein FNV43_RR09557 [Rhamnella rubrinervis]|uniref:Uncharacterized protein n=1 Tax=Rhamnella rubrinervis TaxID=2594499 RepID=A0A8K0HBJ6_9ROSA|nr:hypothetical protein FNV43_RR09557 [Rhamnella rubrinervis]
MTRSASSRRYRRDPDDLFESTMREAGEYIRFNDMKGISNPVDKRMGRIHEAMATTRIGPEREIIHGARSGSSGHTGKIAHLGEIEEVEARISGDSLKSEQMGLARAKGGRGKILLLNKRSGGWKIINSTWRLLRWRAGG